eukprot:COSAG04_NODE_4898_length_1835_cov_2.555300_3_plen_125_part_01
MCANASRERPCSNRVACKRRAIERHEKFELLRRPALHVPRLAIGAPRWERAVAQVAAGDGPGRLVTGDGSSMCGRLEMSCALLGALLGCCSAPELRHRRQLQAAEPEPLGISERCSARVEEFAAF